MGRHDRVWVELDGWIAVETDKAIGITEEYPAEEVDHWIPKSQLDGITYAKGGDADGDDIRKGERITAVRIPRWLAEEKDLDYAE